MMGHWDAGVQKRELGWAAGLADCGVQGAPSHDSTDAPDALSSSSSPSQYTPPSLVAATLVKTVFCWMEAMAMGLVRSDVPGATPKKPASGLMALSLPSESNFIQAMSSPTHVIS